MAEDMLPFDEAPFPGWADGVNRWRWNAYQSRHGRIEGWWKTGECLRCQHSTTVETGLVATLDVNLSNEIYAQCECKITHLDGQVGCGASAMVEGPDGG